MVFGHLFVGLDDLVSPLSSYPQEVLLVKGLLRLEIEYTQIDFFAEFHHCPLFITIRGELAEWPKAAVC
jgi:hypothetical protein